MWIPVLRRAVAYGDDSNSLLLWYDVEELQTVMNWEIPETSPWANTKVWLKELKASPQPKDKQITTGSAPRVAQRGTAPRSNVPRGTAQRGRGYPPRGRGRGLSQSQSYKEESWEDNRSQPRRYNNQEQDWWHEPRERYTSGPGRASGPPINYKREYPTRPGYKEPRGRREESRDRKDRRDRDRYYSRQQEEFSQMKALADTRRGSTRRNYGSKSRRFHAWGNLQQATL